MKSIKKLLVLIAVVAFVAIGCGGAKPADPKAAGEHGSKDLTETVKAAKFEMVNTAEVKKIVGNGVFNPATGIIVDARPAKAFDAGHIPASISIPDTVMMKSADKFLEMLTAKKVTKETLIVTYCGGVTCIKSLNVAKILRDNGYKNVKIYLDGIPVWNKTNNYLEVSGTVAKEMWDKGTGTFIDARPTKVYRQGTIPGSASLPDTQFDKQKLVIYCGGFSCEKSHKVADMLIAAGLPAKMINVYAGGLPEWKQSKYPMGDAVVSDAPKKSAIVPVADIKLGSSEGTVDTAWFVNAVNTKTLPKNVTIVDVRTAAERANGFIEGSVNADSNMFYKVGCAEYLKKIPAEGAIVLHCASGGRAGEMYDNLTLPANEDGCALPKNRIFYLNAHTKFGAKFAAE